MATSHIELPTVTGSGHVMGGRLGNENQVVKHSNPNSNSHRPCDHEKVIEPSESPSSYLQKQSDKYLPPSGAVKIERRDGSAVGSWVTGTWLGISRCYGE